MAFGKDIFCHGIEPYNFRDTDETVATITANVGQSTAIGPKVAIRRNKPFPSRGEVVAVDMGGGKSSSNITRNISPTITCTHGGEPVIGTIDASIYKKNSFQDNSKYIIERKTRKEKMEKMNPTEVLKQAIGNGKDVLGIINLSETLLRIVAEGVMTMDEAIVSLGDIRKSLGEKAEETETNVDAAVEKAKSMGAEYAGAREVVGDDKTDALSHRDAEVADDDGEEMCIVRRLTPTETSRLQGFPDDYTKIDGKDTADAPQFKSHGNSWATPCANFVSVRVEMELRRLGHEGTINYATCCSGIEAHSVAVKGLDWKSIFFSEIEPFPCRVLAAHYPTTPNLGDMTQIHYDAERGVITNEHAKGEEYSLPSCFKEAPIQEIPFKEGDLQVFSGGTPCFVAGTMVLTEKGYKPIEEVKVGERVVTHLGRLRRVVAIGNKKAENIVAVTVASRQPILCTSDHKFWSAINPHQDYRRKSDTYLKILFDGVEFKEIAKIGIGGFVSQLNTYNLSGEEVYVPSVYKATPEDIIELAGWYVGDGHCRRWTDKNKKALILSLSASKVERFKKEFGDRIEYGVNPHGENGVYRITICSTALCDWLIENFGEKSYNKTIPAWVIGGGARIQNRFIAGYMSTDGFSRPKKHIEKGASTTSYSLALGLADLFGKSCVCEANVPPTKTMYDGRVVNQRKFWTVKQHTNPNRFHEYGMWNMVRVRKIEPRSPDTVYNITVEEDHSYVVNGLCVKNCQDISVAGKRKGMAEDSGSRSSLAFHYQRIIDESKPTFTIWENVPGAFSSNGGADFIWFVNKCAESGYAMAWRVLDAQWTMTEEFPRAVPQRRRRIWLVGYKGNDWRIPARIVFELEKNLTANPPIRVPGLGFKTLNEEAEVEIDKVGLNQTLPATRSDNLMGLVMESDDGRKDLLKVSQMIDFSEMPDESDFSKVSMASIYEFAKKVGEPGYIGSVFRTDKKKKKAKVEESTMDLFSMLDAPKPDSEAEKKVEEDNEPEEWVGAEKITPAILENIGNAGILANGRICTMNCHEWTSGIQLTPSTYNAWEQLVKHKDWLKANDLLPEAYDETVCGLSDVLQEDPDEKYNLSWRACFGILKRAETRGKELPPALAIALVSTIRENAGIVKWVALNGRDTKKKETDLTERESAMLCFEKFIASVAKFEEVEAVQPKKKQEGEDDDESEEEAMDLACEINLDDGDAEDSYWDKEKLGEVDGIHSFKTEVPKMPNGVINVSGGETAATLIASGDAAVGTTQDANVIAVKK